MGILEFINLWLNRKRKFKEEYGVDFPETEKQREEITDQVTTQLTKASKEMGKAFAILEDTKTRCSLFKDPESAAFMMVYDAMLAEEYLGKYERLSGLARFAGFSKKFVDHVEEKSEEIGAIT